MNHRSVLRCCVTSLALFALFSRPCQANSLCFLSPDATKQVEVRMLHEGDLVEGNMEIRCLAIDQMRFPAGKPLVIDRVDSEGSHPVPHINWSPDSRYVTVILSYHRHDVFRVFGFHKDKPFEVSTSAVNDACPDLHKNPGAANEGKNSGAGIYLDTYDVAWTKDSRLVVRHDFMNRGNGDFTVELLFDPETAQASNVRVDDVEQKQPSPPAKAVPAAPPAKTGFWRIFKR